MSQRWRRWLRRILIGLVLLVAWSMAREWYARWQARSELDAVVAELDRTEPRWRLEDIEADRAPAAPEENSAPVVVAVKALLPPNWLPNWVDELEKRPPPVVLDPATAEQLTQLLQDLQAARAIALTLEDRPRGRYAIEYAPDFISTLIKDQGEARPVAKLLELDVWDAAQRNEPARAWRAHRALLNTGCSLGDEPLLVSVLVRMAIEVTALRSLERLLAQTELLPSHLAERQAALEAETRIAFFQIGMRGERAGNHHLMTNIETGKLGLLETLTGAGGKKKPAQLSWWDRVSEFYALSGVLQSHVTTLRVESKMVEATRLPAPQRYQALLRIDQDFQTNATPFDRSQILARLVVPAVIRVAQAEQRVSAQLACTVVALATERYRLKQGHWPKTLDQLVAAGLLPEIPVDPFDGQPLRLAPVRDGVVIYSVDKAGTYDGHALDDLELFDPSTGRMEFRLWDPAQRRQAPRPPAEAS